jgi:hypothetical protein
MSRLPAYGRELLTARLSGFSPSPLPWARPGSPGFVLVTDSWLVARMQRELERAVVVIEPGAPYDWVFVKGLIVWLATSCEMPGLLEDIRRERPAEAGDYLGRSGYTRLLNAARSYFAEHDARPTCAS